MQIIVGTLNRKRLGDTVVLTILRHRATFSMSNIIPLLGFGKVPMKIKILKGNEDNGNHIVNRTEKIVQLQREVNLTNDQLHEICQFMKLTHTKYPIYPNFEKVERN